VDILHAAPLLLSRYQLTQSTVKRLAVDQGGVKSTAHAKRIKRFMPIMHHDLGYNNTEIDTV
jgi:hypothetical protein